VQSLTIRPSCLSADSSPWADSTPGAIKLACGPSVGVLIGPRCAGCTFPVSLFTKAVTEIESPVAGSFRMVSEQPVGAVSLVADSLISERKTAPTRELGRPNGQRRPRQSIQGESLGVDLGRNDHVVDADGGMARRGWRSTRLVQVQLGHGIGDGRRPRQDV